MVAQTLRRKFSVEALLPYRASKKFPFLVAPKWIKMFVLDEADEMLSRGFKDQIYEIFQKLSTNIQVKSSLM